MVFFSLTSFFSGSEVALPALDRKRLEENFQKDSTTYRYLNTLLENPRRLIIILLLSNILLITIATILATSYTINLSAKYNISRIVLIPVEVVVLLLLYLFFNALLPKLTAERNPLSFSKTAAIPLYWTSIILYPIAEILTETILLLFSFIKISPGKHAISNSEITQLAEVSHETGTIKEEEHDLIQSLVASKTKIVREIMVHRTEIFAVPFDISLDDLIDTIRKISHNRIPVYKENIDNIVGVIYTKDLLPYVVRKNQHKHFQMQKILRSPLVVPETKLISDLMREFQEKKMHLAMIVDEFGGTSGLVTLENIIEEIIGEIRDEESQEQEYFRNCPDGSVLVNAAVSIADFRERFGIDTTEEDSEFDTAGGWIFSKIGFIPSIGYSFEFQNIIVKIEQMRNNRISIIRVSFKQ